MGVKNLWDIAGLEIVCLLCDKVMKIFPPVGISNRVDRAKSCCKDCLQQARLR
ncbi:MAG: hypothetical protein MI923_08210 [Phycisphaerales bacterium]|nr:hypothetical protein [Phycisphaerales bacterium]